MDSFPGFEEPVDPYANYDPSFDPTYAIDNPPLEDHPFHLNDEPIEIIDGASVEYLDPIYHDDPHDNEGFEFHDSWRDPSGSGDIYFADGVDDNEQYIEYEEEIQPVFEEDFIEEIPQYFEELVEDDWIPYALGDIQDDSFFDTSGPINNGGTQIIYNGGLSGQFPDPGTLKEHYCILHPAICENGTGLAGRDVNGTTDWFEERSVKDIDMSGVGLAILLLLLLLFALQGGKSKNAPETTQNTVTPKADDGTDVQKNDQETRDPKRSKTPSKPANLGEPPRRSSPPKTDNPTDVTERPRRASPENQPPAEKREGEPAQERRERPERSSPLDRYKSTIDTMTPEQRAMFDKLPTDEAKIDFARGVRDKKIGPDGKKVSSEAKGTKDKYKKYYDTMTPGQKAAFKELGDDDEKKEQYIKAIKEGKIGDDGKKVPRRRQENVDREQGSNPNTDRTPSDQPPRDRPRSREPRPTENGKPEQPDRPSRRPKDESQGPTPGRETPGENSSSPLDRYKPIIDAMTPEQKKVLDKLPNDEEKIKFIRKVRSKKVGPDGKDITSNSAPPQPGPTDEHPRRETPSAEPSAPPPQSSESKEAKDQRRAREAKLRPVMTEDEKQKYREITNPEKKIKMLDEVEKRVKNQPKTIPSRTDQTPDVNQPPAPNTGGDNSKSDRQAAKDMMGKLRPTMSRAQKDQADKLANDPTAQLKFLQEIEKKQDSGNSEAQSPEKDTTANNSETKEERTARQALMKELYPKMSSSDREKYKELKDGKEKRKFLDDLKTKLEANPDQSSAPSGGNEPPQETGSKTLKEKQKHERAVRNEEMKKVLESLSPEERKVYESYARDPEKQKEYLRRIKKKRDKEQSSNVAPGAGDRTQGSSADEETDPKLKEILDKLSPQEKRAYDNLDAEDRERFAKMPPEEQGPFLQRRRDKQLVDALPPEEKEKYDKMDKEAQSKRRKQLRQEDKEDAKAKAAAETNKPKAASQGDPTAVPLLEAETPEEKKQRERAARNEEMKKILESLSPEERKVYDSYKGDPEKQKAYLRQIKKKREKEQPKNDAPGSGSQSQPSGPSEETDPKLREILDKLSPQEKRAYENLDAKDREKFAKLPPEQQKPFLQRRRDKQLLDALPQEDKEKYDEMDKEGQSQRRKQLRDLDRKDAEAKAGTAGTGNPETQPDLGTTHGAGTADAQEQERKKKKQEEKDMLAKCTPEERERYAQMSPEEQSKFRRQKRAEADKKILDGLSPAEKAAYEAMDSNARKRFMDKKRDEAKRKNTNIKPEADGSDPKADKPNKAGREPSQGRNQTTSPPTENYDTESSGIFSTLLPPTLALLLLLLLPLLSVLAKGPVSLPSGRVFFGRPTLPKLTFPKASIPISHSGSGTTWVVSEPDPVTPKITINNIIGNGVIPDPAPDPVVIETATTSSTTVVTEEKIVTEETIVSDTAPIPGIFEEKVVVEERKVVIGSDPQPSSAETTIVSSPPPVTIKLSGPADPERIANLLFALAIISIPLILDFIYDWPLRQPVQPNYLPDVVHWLIIGALVIWLVWKADQEFGWSQEYGPYLQTFGNRLPEMISPLVVNTIEGGESLLWGLEDAVFGEAQQLLGMALSAVGMVVLSQRYPSKFSPSAEHHDLAVQMLVVVGFLVISTLLVNA